MKVGERLESLRLEKDITTQEVCEAIGVEIRTYYRWVKNEHLPNLKYVGRLSKLYKITPSELLNKVKYRDW